MKLNRLYLIVFFILISLTLGTVNASDDVSMDNLTVSDDEIVMESIDDVKQDSPDSMDVINSEDNNDELGDYEDDFIYLNDDDIGNFKLSHQVRMDKDYTEDVISISFYNKVTGDFKVFVDDDLKYSHKLVKSDYNSNWFGIMISPQDLKMDSYGDYHVKVYYNDRLLGERDVNVCYNFNLEATSEEGDMELEDVEYLKLEWGEMARFCARLPSDAKGGSLTLTIDDKTYNLRIGEIFRVNTSNWKIGEHKLIAKYSGDSKYNVERTDELLVYINPKITYPDELFYGETTVISFQAPKDAQGTAKIYLGSVNNPKKLLKTVEIKNGAGKYITNLKKKVCWLLIEYNFGDYNNSQTILILMKKPKIQLALKSVNVKKSSKKLTLKATLKFSNKKVKNIKLKFKFNKMKFKAKTNKNGVAKVTIPKSTLKKLKVGTKVKYSVSYEKTKVKKRTSVGR